MDLLTTCHEVAYREVKSCILFLNGVAMFPEAGTKTGKRDPLRKVSLVDNVGGLTERSLL
jgi:DNA-binding sugar fermentation-stimulating protein